MSRTAQARASAAAIAGAAPGLSAVAAKARTAVAWSAALALAPLLAGCALLTKSEPVEPAYFSPESLVEGPAHNRRPSLAEAAAQNRVASRNGESAVSNDAVPGRGLALRLGRIGGGSYLKERIVHRDAEHQIGFYADRRWTERPEVYLERALERAFFEERGLRRALSGVAATLTADLIAFEEVRGPRPGVRLRISYALHDDQQVLREKTFTVERTFDAGTPVPTERVAAALGDALLEAVAQIADQVVLDLAAPPTP